MDRRRAAAALLALAACIACSEAAPTTTNHTALELHDGSIEGCYYNFQHYGEGDRIMTNEPCLNCTCHNRMLMCYLRVCPFTKAIGQDCTVEKRADQCCPIVTCPDVPVDLLTSTSTSSPAEYGATGLGKLDKYGCSIHGKYFPEGAKVPPTPNKPCEHCYCIRNMTTCVMQECTLHVDGCTPIYHKDVCCPVRYSCDHPEDEIPLLDDMTTTVRPTPGFLLTTTTLSPVTQMSQECVHDDQIFPDGALIKTEKACEHCYCMKGDIVCVVQECGTPMENEGKNCTSLLPRHGQCCPDTYICEGDERVTDSTTEIVELTSSPPRRVEGSGYRNEPDEPYTEISPVTTETEGSGEEFTAVSQIDTGDNIIPKTETTEIIEDILFTTTESSMQLGQSTEPDKGQNTIPDTVIDIENIRESKPDKVTLSSFDESTPTISEQFTTLIDLFDHKNEISTTQSVLRVDDESVSGDNSSPKDHEKETTDSSDFLSKTTMADENMIHTNPTIMIEPDQLEITTPTTEFTNKVQEPSKQEDISTETFEQSSVTDQVKFTDVFKTSPEAETSIESTTVPVTKLVVTEITVDTNINEVDDKVSPISSPSRIPGEGDCLLNGITYNNNTNVPSTNNCHTGCKCISSIIKCDPIICSPPPEYMENMNDCQPIYDTPNSCCPTYVCSVKETIPPESHSHMSGTESPKPVTASECSGNDCIVGIEKKPSVKPTVCTSGDCLSETPIKQEECDSKDCKSQVQTSPSIPTQDCSDGQCQIVPVEPCVSENCKKEAPKDIILEKDLVSTKTPALQTECASSDCKDEVQTSSPLPSQECSDGKCQTLPVVPCEGDNCKSEAPKDTISEIDLESTKTPAIQEECDSIDCKVQTSSSIPSQDCSYGKCQTLPVLPCEGNNCKSDAPNDIILEKDLGSTITPDIQEECNSKDCKDQVQTSPSIPSHHCADGNCQIVPCEGENCKTEASMETGTEKDLEPSKICNEENGCDENNLIGQDECVDESCKQKDVSEVGVKLPTQCSGPDCKLHEEPTVQSTEQASEIQTEGSTVSDLNQQKTETIDLHVTTTKEKLTGSDKDVTRPPVYTEYPEKQSTAFEPIVTELPNQYSTENILQTEIPIIQTATELYEEAVTKTETLQTESPKYPDVQSTVSQDNYIHTDDTLSTKLPEYLETETEESFTQENEQSSTDKPHVYTDSHEIITAEEHTKASQNSVTESEITQTKATTSEISEEDDIKTESPEIIEKEEFEISTSDLLETEKEKTTEASLPVMETMLPAIIITEKETMQSESPGEDNENELFETKVPVTEKEIQDEVTEIFIEPVDVQTKAPGTYATEQESTGIKVTAREDETTELVNPEKFETVTEINLSETPEKLGTEKVTIKPETEKPMVTVVDQSKADDSDKDDDVTKKQEDQKVFQESATEKETIEASVPDQHEMKQESTTTHSFDEASEKVQTVISLNPITEEAEPAYVTKESILEPQTTTTKKPEIIVEEKIYDDSQEPKPTKPEDLPTDEITEIATEHFETDATKSETVSYDKGEGVTESINEPILIEEIGEITTLEPHRLETEEQEMYTKSPQDIGTKLGEKEMLTDKDMLYTTIPDLHETIKSDDISDSIDQSVTESQVTNTKESEILASQHDETSTAHDVIFTEKYEGSSIIDTESTLQPTNLFTNEQEKHSEDPVSLTTKLPELYPTLSVEIITTATSTDKPNVMTTLDLDKYDKDPSDKIHYTTLKTIEELPTTESSILNTEKPDISATIQTSTDAKLDLESSYLTTKIAKEPESSTDSLDFVTETSKSPSDYTVLTQENTESHKDTSDHLTTQSTYKDELPTESHETVSHQTSYTKAVTESDVETSSKMIVKDVTETQDEITTTRYQITENPEISELDASFTKTSEFDIVAQKEQVTNTINEVEVQTETQYATEKEGLKPFTSDEQSPDTTENSGEQKPHLPENTNVDLFTTQTASELPLEITTEKTSFNKEEDTEIKEEMSTKVPASTAMFEQSTFETEDRITTKPQILYTSSTDKVPTTLDNINIQKEHEPESDILLTTLSSLEPDKKITESPMSLVTHIDHVPSSQTTSSDEIEMTEQATVTNVVQKLDEKKTQTTLPEIYVTELQKKQSTETPSYHTTLKELETETYSKSNVEESNNFNTDQAERSTTPIMQDDFSDDRKTTEIPIQQYDSTDGPVAGTVSNEYVPNTEDTPTLSSEDTIVDSQPQNTTTIKPLTEKEPNHFNEPENLLPEPVEGIVITPPDKTQTVQEDMTTTTSSIVLDDEHVKETISTTSTLIQQQETEHPEINIYDSQTVVPEKDTSEMGEFVGTETPKLSTDKESETGTSIYIPIVSESTEKPLLVSETSESDNIEKDKPTEIEIQSVDKSTTITDLVNEDDVRYTQSKPLSDTTETQQNESSNEASDIATKVPDQFIASTEKIFTVVSEQDEKPGISGSSDSKNASDDSSSHSTSLIPEISTLSTETQTEPTGVEKVTTIKESLPEDETPKPIATVQEADIQTEIYSTQSAIEKVSFTTEPPAQTNIETEKIETGVHTPTEFTPTTLESSHTEAQSAQTHTEFDMSEDQKETTEPGHELSDTTPFLVELKEHTHQVMDDSSRTSTEVMFTTALYESHHTERGDQNLDVTDKYEDEYKTSTPITEHEQEDKLGQDQKEQRIPTTTSINEDITERPNDIKPLPTISSELPEIDLVEQEKQYTTTVQDVVITTSGLPQTVSEKEWFTTISPEPQKVTYPAPETSSISTEKDNDISTKKPLQSEASMGTTLLEEDLSRVTSQATTSKIVEETTKFSPLTDKPSQPEEKPIKMTPSPSTQELAKPVFDDEINEGIPSPDFPPSGTGGYGQEPDYVEEDQAFGPGTCRYGGKVYVSAQQIPRDDPCDFCFCFRSDIICLQQSCPPPIHGCHEEPIQGFCCPRYECPVSMATTLNVTTTTTTTTTTLPPHFLPHAYKGAAQRRGCQIKGHTYKVGEVVRASSGPCLHCTCGGDGQMKCDPKACTPEPMLRQMIAAAVSAKRRR
ncbi:titin isoform X1 [Pararge aegeria]|uniref:titin isoform X1 n=1 Tax=Pararge aegeria TaxID=116150 RepID=UPI0019D2B07C|nr:titin isoform X1 [Pararge aegeria]